MAKFNSLALGFKEGSGRLMCLNSPSEAFKVKGQEVSFNCKHAGCCWCGLDCI